MTEKELYISQYKLQTRIVVRYEIRLKAAKKDQKQFVDFLKKYDVSENEMKEMCDELYAEEKKIREEELEKLNKKLAKGAPFKYGDMWVFAPAESGQKDG